MTAAFLTRMRRPRRIVFTGDFLRVNAAGDRPTQHHNIRWLRNLVSTQIAMATGGLPAQVFGWDANDVRDGGLTLEDVQRIYRMFGLPLDIRSWAALHGLQQVPPGLGHLLEHVFGDALVIAFEPPPWLAGWLTRQGIPHVAATMHPVRFLDDIFLAFRSNVVAAHETLFAHRIDEAHVRTMAGVQKAGAARYFNQQLRPNSALFLMQTWYDQSQIMAGRFVDAARYLDAIAGIAAEHSEFLIKEHPLAPNPATRLLLARLPNARLVGGNAYGYMSVPEITRVVTISSSVGIEARYFGLDSRFLLRNPVPLRLGPDDPADHYVGVQDAFLRPDFWRAVLGHILPVTAPDGVVVPFKPNRLRISMRSFWNFNEIDTDVTSALGRKG